MPDQQDSEDVFGLDKVLPTSGGKSAQVSGSSGGNSSSNSSTTPQGSAPSAAAAGVGVATAATTLASNQSPKGGSSDNKKIAGDPSGKRHSITITGSILEADMQALREVSQLHEKTPQLYLWEMLEPEISRISKTVSESKERIQKLIQEDLRKKFAPQKKS